VALVVGEASGGEAGDCQRCAILVLVPVVVVTCPSATCPPARSPHGGRLGGQNLPPRHHPSPPGGRPGGGDQQRRHLPPVPKTPRQSVAMWAAAGGAGGPALLRERRTVEDERRVGATCPWTVSRGHSGTARWRNSEKAAGGAQLPPMQWWSSAPRAV
ncbi:hypothetical protein MRX96_047153, partial [Rhipicephalus microplus]